MLADGDRCAVQEEVHHASTMPGFNKVLRSNPFPAREQGPVQAAARVERPSMTDSPLLVNHRTEPLPATARPGPEVRAFHRRLPGYAPTPLRDVPVLAAACKVGRVLVKDESSRMGLPAFKILGASWATYRVLCERLAAASPGPAVEAAEPEWASLDELAATIAERLGPLRLVTATDGNHGRAVARMARLLGLSATILMPDGSADARVAGIEAEGAAVDIVPGTYDDAVAESAAMADERTLVVSDTSWPGYDGPPRWVIDGYSTIFAEVDEQLRAQDLPPIDVAVVPVGVGALAAAAAESLRPGVEPGDGPLLVGVEPERAACVAASVAAGRLVEVPGPHDSIMAGLNCGLASLLALPTITAAFDAFVTVDDDRCRDAIRALAAAGLDVGETGAASLAGLAALVGDHRDELPLPEAATVLLLVTEGVTDPVAFGEIVGRVPG
jgi:diaminopropionate ammonia-lyase